MSPLKGDTLNDRVYQSPSVDIIHWIVNLQLDISNYNCYIHLLIVAF
jgi:hypothetical protein